MKRWLWALGFVLATRNAAADHVGPPIGAEGTDGFFTNNYKIDLFQGPVLGGARMTGLGGAYAPIAEGVAGFQVNAASPAVRPAHSRSWFDYDYDLGVTFPNSLKKTDFDNNGKVGFAYTNFIFFTAGLNLQFGNWGIGFSAQLQQYELGKPDDSAPALRMQLLRGNFLVARSLFDGQLVIGAGARAVSLGISARQGATTDSPVFSTASLGTEAGVLIAPLALPMRFAFTGRSVMEPSATSTDAVKYDGGDRDHGLKYVDLSRRLYLPRSVELPWEVEAAVAFQIGRPLNQQWINTHHPPDDYLREEKLPDGGTRRVLDKKLVEQKAKQKYLALPRQKLLIVASALVSGPVADAVGVESFLNQRVERSGQRASVTPRIGIETEPFANAVQIRAGSYLEPSRFVQSSSRLHGTLGVEVRLFEWSVFGLLDPDTAWRVGAYGDYARNYLAWGLTAGMWY
jgi:hypothetical protein